MKNHAVSFRPVSSRIPGFMLLIILAGIFLPVSSQEIRYPGGRIALSFDGNQHDKDDWGASALALAMIDAAGLNGLVVHVDFNNHLGDSNAAWEEEMVESVMGGADRFNMDRSVLFDNQDGPEAATANLADAINASSAGDPLWILAAGPMETVYRGIAAADPEKRQFVTVISHSRWNQNHGDTPQMTRTWSDLKNDFSGDGVFLVESSIDDVSQTVLEDPSKLPDQNRSNGDFDFNTPEETWYWLRDSPDPDWQWLFGRDDKNGFDVSDAGMTYFLISGGPHDGGCKTCGVEEVRQLLENPVEREKQFLEKDHYLCFEAEETSSELDLWKPGTSVSNYTGPGHLEFTGNGINGGDPKSPLEYRLKITNPGRYRLVIRAHKRLEGAEPDKCNDGWVRMEGDLSGNTDAERTRLTRYTKFFGGAAGGWGWAEKLDEGHTKYTAEYELSAGLYTFTIAGRSIRWNIDRVVFYDVSEYSLNWAKDASLPLTPVAENGVVPRCVAVTHDAIEDFPGIYVPGFVPASKDFSNGCLAVNAEHYPDRFGAAWFTYKGDSGTYNVMIRTLAEAAGESTYRLAVNGEVRGSFTNPPTESDLSPVYHVWDGVKLNTGDTIRVEFNSVSNGTLPEGDGYAYAWGRWSGLSMVRQGCSFEEETVPPPPPPGPNSRCILPETEGGNGLDTLLQFAYQSSPQEIPGTVWAWKFDQGGEGIAYHDADSGNNGEEWGNTERNGEDVDLLDKNGDDIPETGWTQAGEWLEYTVRVTRPGRYRVHIRAAANGPGKTVYLKVDGEYTTCAIELQSTGDLKTYAEVTGYDTLSLSEGTHTLTVVSQSDQLNLESFRFTHEADLVSSSMGQTSAGNLALYPNPACGWVEVSLPGGGSWNSARCRIFDLAGRLVLEPPAGPFSGSRRIALTGAPPGAYVLALIMEDRVYRKKFVVSEW